MKRLHIHIGVEQLEEAIGFYSKLFGAEPVKRKPDYAKWMLEDPPVNLAISTRASTKGVDHLGIQVEEEQELNDIRHRLKAGNLPVSEEGESLCCYAKSDKSWVLDPAGVPWEAYRTMEDAEIFSTHSAHTDTACCEPAFLARPETTMPVQESSGCCS
ncbi:MAG TPA: ArsI/CadI family heavy metal resistance metalloenzyme [Nitrospirales bacterium]|nr:glyoxalase/bleomycin resistance/dioxygenase family protein [Nitrospiraceae bacterium]HNP28658.1 ArsI/CadI family heavy metal resistance metalloenzyme [Nitrospirales bacterium]